MNQSHQLILSSANYVFNGPFGELSLLSVSSASISSPCQPAISQFSACPILILLLLFVYLCPIVPRCRVCCSTLCHAHPGMLGIWNCAKACVFPHHMFVSRFTRRWQDYESWLWFLSRCRLVWCGGRAARCDGSSFWQRTFNVRSNPLNRKDQIWQTTP